MRFASFQAVHNNIDDFNSPVNSFAKNNGCDKVMNN
jgi:hypothetical protein